MKNQNRIYVIIFLLVSVGMIVGGYKYDQGGTVMVGVIFGMFALACAKLTIVRK